MRDKDQERLQVIEDSWTDCVRLLKSFKGAWDRHRNLVWAYREMGVPLDALPPRLQKDLSQTFQGSEFWKALPQLTNYYRRQGGIDMLYMKKKEAKEENGTKVE